MAYHVNHVNKKTGVTYVYESVSVWDKERKQSRNKQVCIGKIDPVSGEFVASKRLDLSQAAARDPAVTATTQIVGPALILDAFATRTGVARLLRSCFPEVHSQILLMAYYLAIRGGPLSHCGVWAQGHDPQLAASVSSQRISEILATIGVDEKQRFFSEWIARTPANDHICYDITSVSSYSQLNEYIKWGHNRDLEKLPQLNLAMLFGQESGLPVYYHRIPGSITDVSTLRNLVATFKALEVKRLHYVMDKGFYSKANVDILVENRDQFTISVPLNNTRVQQAIDEVYETIHGPEGYRAVDEEILYVHSRLFPWGPERRRCYLHLYYNATNRAQAIDRFNEELIRYKEELETGSPVASHQEAYDTFLLLKTTPKRGLSVSYNTDAVSKYIKRYAGFQALLSNGIKDPVEALRVYRDKDVVEKCFDDLKNSLDMRRLRMHSSVAVDGRLFVQFIALILISAIRKQMRSSELIRTYTIRELLWEMETLSRIRYTGKYRPITTEVTKAQREILTALHISQPGAA